MAINTLATATIFQTTLDQIAVQEANDDDHDSSIYELLICYYRERRWYIWEMSEDPLRILCRMNPVWEL